MKAKSSQSRSTDAAFSMDDFAAALEQYDYQFQKGQIVRGKVVSYSSDGAFIDIGGKSPGFIPEQEAGLQRVVDVSVVLPLDEERDFLIIREQDADGQVLLSLRQLEEKKAWDRFAESQDANQSMNVRVTGINKGGVTVDAQGLRGFIPRSHLVERDDLAGLVGTTLSATILELDPERKKLVLSNRLATRSAAMSQFEAGQLVEGKVTGIKPFGVFVDLDGATALLHIQQVSQKYVNSLADLFEIGQIVKAMIADIDEGRGRISLSTKVLENFPGEMIEQPAQVMDEADSRESRARKQLMGE